MRKLTLTLLLILGLVLSQAALGQEEPMAGDGDRKARILANLKVKFPQLAQANVTMGALEPSGYGSLDQGSFSVNGKPQRFLVSPDDKALFFISDPIDVSLSTDEIEVELAQKAAKEAEVAAARAKELAELVAGLPARGNPDAPVTIVEWSDFQCPFCARGAKTVDEILEKYPEDVKVVFQHFPLNFHPWAKPAAIAADCAGKQSPDAFWSLHDKLFENQKALNLGNVLAKSKEFLADAEIDIEQWSTCAEDKESAQYKEVASAVDASMALGQKLGVSGTPGFFVNGRFLSGAQPLAAFEPLIAEAKKDAS